MGNEVKSPEKIPILQKYIEILSVNSTNFVE